MSTRLCYNSTDRRYELRSGQRVLSSHLNRQDALLAQLTQEAPEVLALAQPLIAAHPVLTDRALRAVALVANGAVQANGSAGCYHVRSQQGKQAGYEVDLDTSTCTCPDWEQRAPTVNGRTLCKHILAALFTRRLGAPTQPLPNRKEVMTVDRP